MGLQEKAGSGSDEKDRGCDRTRTVDVHDRTDLVDGRKIGDWDTRYGRSAWLQIVLELCYLVLIVAFGTTILIDTTIYSEPLASTGGVYQAKILDVALNQSSLKWISLWTAGLLGGAVFDLKWLYHSIAKGVWNRDRLLWRLIVPFNSATVSLFTGFLFASGTVPFMKNESFETPLTLLAFGFIFGYFSDNILAALQNFAQKIFGTLQQNE